MIENLFWIE